jgi:hypothetical protein
MVTWYYDYGVLVDCSSQIQSIYSRFNAATSDFNFVAYKFTLDFIRITTTSIRWLSIILRKIYYKVWPRRR